MRYFNDILIEALIDPHEVRLLRHQIGGAGKLTPFHVWRESRSKFEKYQQSQSPLPRERSVLNAPYWASFVVNEQAETLFVGLYRVRRLGSVPADWEDPISPDRSGADRGLVYDLYDCKIDERFEPFAGLLVVEWGLGARSWIQHAARREKAIIRSPNVNPVAPNVAEVTTVHELEQRFKSYAAVRLDKVSSAIERGPIGEEIKRLKGGRCQICEALGLDGVCFYKRDGSPYSEAHHVWPVSTLKKGVLGPQNVMVLCANHHREAHYGHFEVEHFWDRWMVRIGEQQLEISKTVCKISPPAGAPPRS